MEWQDVYAPTCEGCKQLYSERNPPEEPPCDTCRPKFIEENEDAVKIFYLVRGQMIMGFDGPIDISHSAIHEAMKLYEIENKKQCFEKVLTMAQSWMNRMREK